MNTKRVWLGTLGATVSLFLSIGCEYASDEGELPRSVPVLGTAKAALQPTPIWQPVVGLGQVFSRPDLRSSQVVGLVPFGGRCPIPADGSGWLGGALFGDEVVPPEPPLSGRFCEYHWAKPDVPAPPGKLPRYCPFVPVNAPCAGSSAESWLEPTPLGAVLLGLSEEARLDIAKAMRTRFKELLGVPSQAPTVGGQMLVPPLPQQSTVYVMDDDGEHARAVTDTLLTAACSESGCPEIASLKVFGDNDAPASAVTISRSLYTMVQQAKTKGKKRVVASMALGVHGSWLSEPRAPNDQRPPRMYLAYEALKAGLNYAAWSGHIVVAAIGNRDGGADDRNARSANPMYPGGWSGKQAWTCEENAQAMTARRIVVAAGAITPDGSDSMTTRINGQAELVAPGFAVPLDKNGDGRLYWEGSSFATAALTGVLSTAWSYMPDAPPEEVIGVVNRAAMPIPGKRTQLCASGSDCAVRRLDLCQSIRGALFRTALQTRRVDARLAAINLSCAQVYDGVPWTKVTLDPRSREDLQRGKNLTWQSADVLPSLEECGAQAVSAAELERAPYSCPFEHLGNGQSSRRMFGSAPSTNGCPTCSIIRLPGDDFRLVGAFDPAYFPIVSSPVLRIRQFGPGLNLTFAKGTAAVDAPTSDQYYELSGLLDVSTSETNLVLQGQIAPDTVRLEVMLEYIIEQPGQAPRAHGIPLPLLDASNLN